MRTLNGLLDKFSASQINPSLEYWMDTNKGRICFAEIDMARGTLRDKKGTVWHCVFDETNYRPNEKHNTLDVKRTSKDISRCPDLIYSFVTQEAQKVIGPKKTLEDVIKNTIIPSPKAKNFWITTKSGQLKEVELDDDGTLWIDDEEWEVFEEKETWVDDAKDRYAESLMEDTSWADDMIREYASEIANQASDDELLHHSPFIEVDLIQKVSPELEEELGFFPKEIARKNN